MNDNLKELILMNFFKYSGGGGGGRIRDLFSIILLFKFKKFEFSGEGWSSPDPHPSRCAHVMIVVYLLIVRTFKHILEMKKGQVMNLLNFYFHHFLPNISIVRNICVPELHSSTKMRKNTFSVLKCHI